MRDKGKDTASWGWQNIDRPRGVIFIEGTLEESYAKVAWDGGRYKLVTSVPPSAAREVLAETAARIAGIKDPPRLLTEV